MKPVDQRAAAILRRMPTAAPQAAEVGVLIGALSDALLTARPDLRLMMVDSWAPAEAQPERYKATGDVHAGHDAARCLAHRRQAEARVARHGPRAVIMARPSAAAALCVPDASLDLVFLDADHSREGVAEDLAAWAPKVRRGGWIGGHDYANPDPAFRFGVKEAVDEWAAARGLPIERDLNFTWFCRLGAPWD